MHPWFWSKWTGPVKNIATSRYKFVITKTITKSMSQITKKATLHGTQRRTNVRMGDWKVHSRPYMPDPPLVQLATPPENEKNGLTPPDHTQPKVLRWFHEGCTQKRSSLYEVTFFGQKVWGNPWAQNWLWAQNYKVNSASWPTFREAVWSSNTMLKMFG